MAVRATNNVAKATSRSVTRSNPTQEGKLYGELNYGYGIRRFSRC